MPDVAKEVRIVRAHHRRVAVASAFLSVIGFVCGCGGQEFDSVQAGRVVDREEAQSADAIRSSAAGSAVVEPPSPAPQAALPRPASVLPAPAAPAALTGPVLVEQGEDGVARPVPSQPIALAAKSSGFENGPAE
jgi:hypothetical protein